ncbi:MAG: ABC transporter ATP-binding protein [Candidatus Omnitrophota bacterium]|nr:ABC transporter ATP-binding protein [Candidatus Omnitrophota bacterium]
MNILQVNNLKTYFYSRHGITRAVDDLTFKIKKGMVFGLVGESGSGKTLTALSIMGLVSLPGKIMGGQAIFDGADLLAMDDDRLRGIRGCQISIVFQEPSTALNPVFTIGYQVQEAILAHQDIGKKKAKELAMEYLKKVHIAKPDRVFDNYPHQLSGGAKQRAMIAASLVNSPDLLILDEPTTALDVTTQARILELLEEIIESGNCSILFITHDFDIIARMCDEVGVMRSGKIVEMGSIGQILNNPKESYTVSLLESAKALA